MLKEYGPKDEDLTAYHKLLDYLTAKDIVPTYIMHHARRPLGAKQCQWPGSVRVQAVLPDNSVVTAVQYQPGAEARIEKG
jgi:hypothetical protein